ncbi:MAG: AtzE family amidohydrolase [Hyphomonadaceae bacterium]|nr:AtzE family amidohydrolase [Hyphomonadaceae bacterium]
MSDVSRMSAVALAEAVRARRLSATAATRDALERIETLDPQLNCCTAVLGESALKAAAEIDARIARGEDAGALAGVPVVVKNLFDVEGVVTLAGAKIRRDDHPARADAAAVRRLREAGVVIVAATNMDEFAYGFTTENEFFGATRNPRDPLRVAGGSSGGSAAAVAAGMAHIGLGSDTNGSIRVPASFSGVFGLKPTFGRLSRAGAAPFVASLDHVGPMARGVEDLALAYDVMQGPDPSDPTCTKRAPEHVRGALGERRKLRVGVLDGWFRWAAEPEALAAVDEAAACLGAKARVELPESDIARAAAFVITAAEAANMHRDNLRRQPGAFDPATRDRLLAGALLPSDYVIQAQRFRRRFQRAAQAVFASYDILLAPATPCAALTVGQRTLNLGGVEMLARAHIGIYTQPLSFIGLPIIAAPMARPGALPIGVQIVGAPWREELVFQAAMRLEQAGLAAAPVAA